MNRGHQHVPRNEEQAHHLPDPEKTEHENGHGRNHRDGNNLSHHLWLFSDEHGAGAKIMDRHGGEEDCCRGAARDSQSEGGNDVTADAGIVTGLCRDEPFDSSFSELLGVFAPPLCREVRKPGCGIAAYAGDDSNNNTDE